jgi:hypothetical protein
LRLTDLFIDYFLKARHHILVGTVSAGFKSALLEVTQVKELDFAAQALWRIIQFLFNVFHSGHPVPSGKYV